MGLFKKEDPLTKLSRVSDLRIIWSSLNGSDLKVLMFPFLMARESNQDVTIFELNTENFSKDFKEFETSFLSQYNQIFAQSRETPRPGGDELTMTFWPNYAILKDSRPFRVLQDSDYQDRQGDTEVKFFDFKEFAMFVYFDTSDPLRLGLLKKLSSEIVFEDTSKELNKLS